MSHTRSGGGEDKRLAFLQRTYVHLFSMKYYILSVRTYVRVHTKHDACTYVRIHTHTCATHVCMYTYIRTYMRYALHKLCKYILMFVYKRPSKPNWPVLMTFLIWLTVKCRFETSRVERLLLYTHYFVLTLSSFSSLDAVQLWYMNNYHWYLKQELRFDDEDGGDGSTCVRLAQVHWDPILPYKLHILTKGIILIHVCMCTLYIQFTTLSTHSV